MRVRPLEHAAGLHRLLDLGGLVVAFTLATWLQSGEGGLPFAEVLALRVKVQNILLFFGLVLAWSGLLTAFGLYRPHIASSTLQELKDLVGAISSCTALLWPAHLLFDLELIGAAFLLWFWVFGLSFSLLSRLVLQALNATLAQDPRKQRHLLIVGTCNRALQLARQIQARPHLGYRLVGFVDENWAGTREFRASSGHDIVTDFSGFPDYIARNVVDEVMLCVPVKSFYERSSRILAQCAEQGITARFVSDMFSPQFGSTYFERFGSAMVLTVQSGGMRGWAVAVKRVVDFVLAAALLLVLSPAMLAIAILIALESGRPILFIQDRMGLNKRRFRLYKFRTMVPDAEARLRELEHMNEATGPVFKIHRDPRVTALGRFLRKSSLDELPQLINVLNGEMSLVGPRPLPVRDYEAFSTTWHRRRFSVRPGITCLWQVMGRHQIPFERWMELDMQYIDQWSLMLDFRILLKTIPAVVRGSGAS